MCISPVKPHTPVVFCTNAQQLSPRIRIFLTHDKEYLIVFKANMGA